MTRKLRCSPRRSYATRTSASTTTRSCPVRTTRPRRTCRTRFAKIASRSSTTWRRSFFTDESVVKKIEKRFRKLREKGQTFTIVHTGDALAGVGVAAPRVKIKFKDAAGKTTNGDTEPKTLASSAWDKVMGKVGTDFGWHIFGMAIMDGHHSVTLFVDNQPEGKTLFWADQWRIDPGDDFFQVPRAISGFRKYEKAGFDKFIEAQTNEWW